MCKNNTVDKISNIFKRNKRQLKEIKMQLKSQIFHLLCPTVRDDKLIIHTSHLRAAS